MHPMACSAECTTLCRALQSAAEELLYQAVLQPDYYLNGASVEYYEGLQGEAKCLQPAEVCVV